VIAARVACHARMPVSMHARRWSCSPRTEGRDPAPVPPGVKRVFGKSDRAGLPTGDVEDCR